MKNSLLSIKNYLERKLESKTEPYNLDQYKQYAPKNNQESHNGKKYKGDLIDLTNYKDGNSKYV